MSPASECGNRGGAGDVINKGFDLCQTGAQVMAVFERIYPQYRKDAIRAIGADLFNKLSERQRAVLVDFAYRAPGFVVGNGDALREAVTHGLETGDWNAVLEILTPYGGSSGQRARSNRVGSQLPTLPDLPDGHGHVD
jgi:hypothetical protein